MYTEALAPGKIDIAVPPHTHAHIRGHQDARNLFSRISPTPPSDSVHLIPFAINIYRSHTHIYIKYMHIYSSRARTAARACARCCARTTGNTAAACAIARTAGRAPSATYRSPTAKCPTAISTGSACEAPASAIQDGRETSAPSVSFRL